MMNNIHYYYKYRIIIFMEHIYFRLKSKNNTWSQFIFNKVSLLS